MRTTSGVISWLSFIVVTIIGFVVLGQGQTTTYYVTTGYYGTGYYTTTNVPYPTWLWIIFIVATVIRIIILFSRPFMLDNGNRAGAGVLTLFFVSFIGGILTFCIPDSDLVEPEGLTNTTTTHYVVEKPKYFTEAESEKEKEILRSIFNKGAIDIDEYNQRLNEINAKTIKDKKPAKPTPAEKADLIIKYKKMLDDGTITEEEFNKLKSKIIDAD